MHGSKDSGLKMHEADSYRIAGEKQDGAEGEEGERRRRGGAASGQERKGQLRVLLGMK